MFERFDERVRRIINNIAINQAHKYGAEFLDVDHIWLGFLIDGEGEGIDALKRTDADLPKLRADITALMPAAVELPNEGKLPRTQTVARIIEFAIGACRRRSDSAHQISTQDLLVALMREAHGQEAVNPIARILTQHNITQARVGEAINPVMVDSRAKGPQDRGSR
ncbi:MAG: Clp protease N-terminal domain-containing protein [Dongiaceae bacterium]